MDEVASSGNDEFYTPAYAVVPLLPYLKPGSRIWCPFDTAESLFVSILTSEGHEVVATHIRDGIDFFTAEPPQGCDYIISNPPYSMKGEVLQRLFDMKIRFAMLVGVVGLFESQKRFDMFASNEFEIMYLNRRVAYFKSYDEQKPSLHPPFSSAYICSGILPCQIVFETIDKRVAA